MTKENKEFNEALLKGLKEKGLDLAQIDINKGRENIISEDFWDKTGMVIKPYEGD